VDQCRCGYDFGPARVDNTPPADVEQRPERRWLVPGVLMVTVAFAITIYAVRSSSTDPPEQQPATVRSQTPPPASELPRPAVAANVPRALVPVDATVPAVPTIATEARPPASFEEIIGRASAAVVSIETGGARGSGFFVTSELVITNAHVVENRGVVTLKLSDGTTMPAQVLRSSPEVDLAILRANTPRAGQAVMAMGSVNGARAGQEVIAIGSALGVLQNTVTRGIVSAVRNASGVILIQTDAAINSGNSGGPLIDRTGRVIGITTLKAASNSESLGFAVAIDHARPLLEGRPAQRVATAPGAPPTSLAGAFARAPSQTDTIRSEGAAQFERAMQAIARRADSLDDYWERYRTACGPEAVANSGDRPWFGVWEKPTAAARANGQCSQWIGDITQMSSAIRSAMASADEAARGASVYPGVQRDLRRKYRMEWAGWDR
jgi:S1-C subfamily serine protease